jgi:hypothetical protein
VYAGSGKIYRLGSECPLPYRSPLFFSRENTARIGRFTVPFPFSAILGILFIPLICIAAPLSIPVTFVSRYFSRRSEKRFAARMKTVGRWLTWNEALSEIEHGRGTLIGEYLSAEGPYLLWWTPDDVSAISLHPCCFEELPWLWESDEFFDWCRSRFTDPAAGTASIVDLTGMDRRSVSRALESLQTDHRCVSTC